MCCRLSLTKFNCFNFNSIHKGYTEKMHIFGCRAQCLEIECIFLAFGTPEESSPGLWRQVDKTEPTASTQLKLLGWFTHTFSQVRLTV